MGVVKNYAEYYSQGPYQIPHQLLMQFSIDQPGKSYQNVVTQDVKMNLPWIYTSQPLV